MADFRRTGHAAPTAAGVSLGAAVVCAALNSFAPGESFTASRGAVVQPLDAVRTRAASNPDVAADVANDTLAVAQVELTACAAKALAMVVAAGALARGSRRAPRLRCLEQGWPRAVRQERALVALCAEPASSESTPASPSAASEDDALESAKAAAELAKLELEAAKLRAEARELEESVAKDRRKARAERILGTEATINTDALKLKLKEVESLDCTQDQIMKLAAICGTGTDGNVSLKMGADGGFALSKEDLTSEGFNNEVDRLMSDIRAATRQAEVVERERVNKEREEERAKNPTPVSADNGMPSQPEGEVNDDRSSGSRILGMLAYLLPLSDATQFIVPLVQDNEFLAVVLSPIALVSIIINAIPFGSFLLLVGFIFAAQYTPFPRLVRFNLEQAVLITISIFLPSLIILGIGASGGAALVPALGGITFAAIFAMVIYCWATTVNGELPDGIPIISDTTKNVVDKQQFGG